MPIPFEKPETRVGLFGGEGSVRVESLHGALQTPFTTALHCELSAAGSVGLHQQASDDEVVIALDGDAVIYVDGIPHGVVPGGVVSIPLGSTLEILNASQTRTFEYLIVKARAPR